MPDDTTKAGVQDRGRVSGQQGYEVRHFANRHGISLEQAQQLIAEHGHSREALDEAARQMKG